jgi:hypothetical protein
MMTWTILDLLSDWKKDLSCELNHGVSKDMLNHAEIY